MNLIELINFEYMVFDYSIDLSLLDIKPGDLVYLEEGAGIGRFIQAFDDYDAYQKKDITSFRMFEEVMCVDFTKLEYDTVEMLRVMEIAKRKPIKHDATRSRMEAEHIVFSFGLRLMYFPEYKDCRAFVKKAVHSQGLAILFASERLKNDEEIVRIAVQSDIVSLFFVDEKFFDLEFIVSCDPNLHIDETIRRMIRNNVFLSDRIWFYQFLLFGGYSKELRFLIPRENVIDYNILSLFHNTSLLPYEKNCSYEAQLPEILSEHELLLLSQLASAMESKDKKQWIQLFQDLLYQQEDVYILYLICQKWEIYQAYDGCYFLWFEDDLVFQGEKCLEQIVVDFERVFKKNRMNALVCNQASYLYYLFTGKSSVFYYEENRIRFLSQDRLEISVLHREDRVMIYYAFMFAVYEVFKVKLPVMMINPFVNLHRQEPQPIVEYINQQNEQGFFYILFSIHTWRR